MVDVVNNTLDIAGIQRASMLRMGKNWQKLGKLNQAIDTYLHVIESHPGTDEAEEAKAALVVIAAGFEGQGRYHLAMSIYERMNEAAA